MTNRFIAVLLGACAVAAMPLPSLAQSRASSTVSVSSPLGISAVYDTTNIQMPAIPGGVAVYERNPDFFQNARLCVAGRDDNWPIRPDGTMHREEPRVRSDGTVDNAPTSARVASCAPIVNGQASVRNPFGSGAVPFIERDGHIIGWAGRDRLTGL